MSFLKSNNVLTRNQYGFQKKKYCCQQLLKCTNTWIKDIDDKTTVDVVYIDFKKAFDTVVHSKLLLKLESLISNRFICSWIRSFLSNRSQKVVLNNTHSDSVPITSGVPQGSVLGPSLFLIFINDIVDSIKHSEILLFADDLKVFNTSHNHDLLQFDLNNLCYWANSWQLSISYSKSNVMYIGKNNPKHVYSLNTHVLVDSGSVCRDLGVSISNDLRSSIHCHNIAMKASKISAMIFRTFVSKDRNLLLQAFKTYVRPQLEYCTPVWNPSLLCDINNVEKIQRRFTKRILYGSQLSYDERLQILNLKRLELRRIHFDAIMAYNIIVKSDLPFDDFYSLPPNCNTRSYDNAQLYIDKFRLDIKRNSFSIRSSRVWNYIPLNLKKAPNVESFKRGLYKLDLSSFLR